MQYSHPGEEITLWFDHEGLLNGLILLMFHNLSMCLLVSTAEC